MEARNSFELFLPYCEIKDDRDTGCSLLYAPLLKVGGHLSLESFRVGSWYDLITIVSGLRDRKVSVADMRH